MAADAPKPAPSKSSRRLHAAGKLTALLGLPLALIGTIFGSGLYVGATRSYRVQTLEARYLGFPDPGGATWTPPSQRTKPAAQDAEAPEPKPDPPDDPPSADTAEATGPTGLEQPKPNTDTGETPPQPVQPVEPPEVNEPEPEPEPPSMGLPVAKVDPIGPELRTKFEQSREVHVKIMVDPALAAAREDWLSYTHGLFSATRASFSALAGIELRLQGVVVWSEAQDLPPTELGAALETHEREGAELILALVARARPPSYEAPQWTEAVHGDHGLVFADLDRSDRYYHNMLRTLARLFGAQASSEPGSFMSPSGSPADAAPVLDPANRGQLIFHKQRPFVSRDDASPDPGDELPEGDTQEM